MKQRIKLELGLNDGDNNNLNLIWLIFLLIPRIEINKNINHIK